MTHMDEMRASDADRERVVSALQEQVGAGRLTLEEFEERSDQAYSAKTIGELRKITHDLPVNLFTEQLTPFGGPQGPWASPYHQGTGQMTPAGGFNPLMLLPLALIAMVIFSNVIGMMAWGGIVIMPLFFLLLIGLRLGGRRHGGNWH